MRTNDRRSISIGVHEDGAEAGKVRQPKKILSRGPLSKPNSIVIYVMLIISFCCCFRCECHSLTCIIKLNENVKKTFFIHIYTTAEKSLCLLNQVGQHVGNRYLVT